MCGVFRLAGDVASMKNRVYINKFVKGVQNLVMAIAKRNT